MLFVIIVLKKILKEKDSYAQNAIITIYAKNAKNYSIKNKYIKENLIGDIIVKRDVEFTSQGIPTDKKIEKVFYELFDIYQNHIQEYEYKNKRLNFRLTSRKYDQFMKVPGKSNTEKLEYLMDFFQDYSSRNNVDIEGWLGDDIDVVSRPAKRM